MLKRSDGAIEIPGKRFSMAYVLYATNVCYGAAALVTLQRLKSLSKRSDIDYVVLHTGLPHFLLKAMDEMGALPVRVKRLPYVSFHYFKDCLVKLRILQLNLYDRIVYLDVDTLVLKSLDTLFELSFHEDMAAPRAYWLPQPCITSLLMVVKPSMKMWARVAPYIKRAHEKALYDMEIFNLAFKGEIHFLHDYYGCLNSEWENKNAPLRFEELDRLKRKVPLVHFSALGKQWQFHPIWVRILRPRAHPFFCQLWKDWWAERSEVVRQMPFRLKWRHLLVHFWCRREFSYLVHTVHNGIRSRYKRPAQNI